jgi:hypothetical protein
MDNPTFIDDMRQIMDLANSIRAIARRQKPKNPELQKLMSDLDTEADAIWCHADYVRTLDPDREPTHQMFVL